MSLRCLSGRYLQTLNGKTISRLVQTTTLQVTLP